MMRNIFFLGIIFLLISGASFSKVLVMTHCYNRPDFIGLQYETFKKFLLDDYEFVVFNDARDMRIRSQIKKVCDKHNISCLEIPQTIHDKPYLQRLPDEDYNHSCCRCANVIQYSLDVLGFMHNDAVVIIDSDMFLVEPFSFKTYLGDFHISGVLQSRGVVNYLWNGIVMINMPNFPYRDLVNFNCGKVKGERVDVGGYLHYLLQKNDLRVLNIDTVHFDGNRSYDVSINLLSGLKHISGPLRNVLCNAMIPNVEILLGGVLFHYRGGSWDSSFLSAQEIAEKSALLNDYIKALL